MLNDCWLHHSCVTGLLGFGGTDGFINGENSQTLGNCVQSAIFIVVVT